MDFGKGCAILAPFGEKPFGEKPFGEKPFGEKPYRRAFGVSARPTTALTGGGVQRPSQPPLPSIAHAAEGRRRAARALQTQASHRH